MTRPIMFGSLFGSDALVGTDRPETFFGLGGNDTIEAGGGNDRILAGWGNDLIRTGAGNDKAWGGIGFDTAIYSGGIEDYTITTGTGPAKRVTVEGEGGRDRLWSVEALTFEADAYTLFLDGRNNAALARDDSATATEGTDLTLGLADLLGNDLEFDGDTLALVGFDVTSALGATISRVGDTLVYDDLGAFASLAGGATLTDTFGYIVDDGRGGIDTATVTVTITGVNDRPEITGPDAVEYAENAADPVATFVASDVDSASVSMSLEGADAALFTLDAGVLGFAAPPDFEIPQDAGGDNTYDIAIVATDAEGAETRQSVAIKVTDVEEGAPREIFAFDLLASSSQRLTDYTNAFDPLGGGAAFGSPGDGFGVFDVDDSASIPFALVDDSAGVFAADTQGIIDSASDTEAFFGITDTVNADTVGPVSATWTFDIAGFSDIMLSVDLAAMGDFESADSFSLTAGIDGAAAVELFAIEVDETAAQTYVLANGTAVSLDDPLTVDGTSLSNSLQTFSSAISGTGTTLELTLTAETNGGSEAVALRNIVLSGIGEPVAPPLAIGTSFEAEAVPGGQYTDAGTDGTALAPGSVVDIANAPGAPVVDSTSATSDAGELGWNATWVNTREDVGLSDGDFIGVTDFTGTVGAFVDGAQGYQLSDADGLLRLEFDEVDLSEAGSTAFSMAYFAAATGWESDDLIAIYLRTDQGDMTLLDTAGQDIDDLGIEGAWITLSQTLSAELDSAQLVVELDSNASSEALFLDAISFAEGDVPPPPPPPPPSALLIGDVQGSAEASGRVGEAVTLTGIVVGDFQNGDADETRNLQGFYLQDAGDGDAATSDGIFVFTGSDPARDVALGDQVTLTGTVDEFFGQTQIDDLTALTVDEAGAVADISTLAQTLDLGSVDATVTDANGRAVPDLEAYEGMLVTITDTLTVNETFQLDRFNEIRLTTGERPQQYTQQNAPDADGFAAYLAQTGSDQIVYDDGLNLQNAAIPLDFDLDGNGLFNTADGFGMGDTVDNLTGVLTWGFAGNSASGNTWRLRSSEDDANKFVDAQTREETPPDVGGNLQVVSFNVLNYFSTLDVPGATTANGSGPRGADTPEEFDRQTEKLVSALAALDADIFGLVELENDFLAGASGNAIESLTASLNAVAGAGTYAWLDPGVQFVGDDAIAVGMIYKPASVEVVAGSIEVLDDSDLAALSGYTDPGVPVFDGPSTNRAPLAATFRDLTGSDEDFTVAVTHMKSKGGTGAGDDADAGDGAGAFNGTRLEGVKALKAWLEEIGDADQLVLGDLNAYAEEDPILEMEAGYTDLEQLFNPGATSYVFDGFAGTLDYAFASDALLGDVTGAGAWQINSVEPDAFDYNTDFGRDPAIFDGSVPYRASDHDPILVGLSFPEVVEAA